MNANIKPIKLDNNLLSQNLFDDIENNGEENNGIDNEYYKEDIQSSSKNISNLNDGKNSKHNIKNQKGNNKNYNSSESRNEEESEDCEEDEDLDDDNDFELKQSNILSEELGINEERNYLSGKSVIIDNFNLKKLSKEELKEILKISINTENYDDSVLITEALIVNFPKIFISEVEFLEAPVKNFIQSKQTYLKKITKLELIIKNQIAQIKNQELEDNIKLKKEVINSEQAIQLIEKQKEKLSIQIQSVCNDYIELIDKYLLKNITSKHIEAFYYNLKADLFKYLSQVSEENSKVDILKKAEEYYKVSIKIAESLIYSSNSTKEEQESSINVNSSSLNNILKNKIYLNNVLSLSGFYLNYTNDYFKAYYLLEEICKSVELQDFYKDSKKFDDYDLNDILIEVKSIFDEAESLKNKSKLD